MTPFGGVVFGFVREGSAASTQNTEWDRNYALLHEVGHQDQTKEGLSFLRNEKSMARSTLIFLLSGLFGNNGLFCLLLLLFLLLWLAEYSTARTSSYTAVCSFSSSSSLSP